MLQDMALVELRRLNAQFIHNFVSCDVASQASIIHPRFTCIMPTGQRLARDEYLKYWATGFDPDVITYWDYRDERIEIFGDVALVFPADDTVVRRYHRGRMQE